MEACKEIGDAFKKVVKYIVAFADADSCLIRIVRKGLTRERRCVLRGECQCQRISPSLAVTAPLGRREGMIRLEE